MSPQADYVVANGTGAAVRSDINGQLAAIVSQNSGATEPTTTYAYMWWADTTTGLLKIRNAANNAWVIGGTLASANLGLATLASPTLTGTPAAPTATAGTNTTQIATTAFVAASFAPLASPTLTGTPAAPTASAGTNTTQLATTAYVVSQAIAKTGGTMTGDLVIPSLNGGQLAGMRNRIINGDMDTDQRNAGAAQTFTAAGALAYSVDRWYGYCTGANVTGQQIAGATAGQFRYRFTGAASVTAIGFGQRIEQLNSADLAGTTATLSVDLANSLLTTVTWTAYYATTADTFGTLASPTRTQIATGTFTVNSTVTRYSTQISVPGAATTGIEIVFTVGAQTSGTWTIGNVQLEPGTVATPFERRSYGQELALCQRYFETIDAGGGRPSGLAFSTSNRAASEAPGSTILYIVTKRTAPTITSSTPTSIRYVSNTGIYTGNNAVFEGINASAFIISCSSIPVASFGWMDTFGTILISAEL